MLVSGASETAGDPSAVPDETEWERRRRLAAVFGETLPDTTRDEREVDPRASLTGEDAGEAWLRAQVPPHHGS